MTASQRTRLAVLGSPIAHSKSPAIHRAAYSVLGIDWRYEAADVTGATLAEYLATRGVTWRGLSLTMPLKRDILPHLHWRDPLVDLVGAANTVLFTDEGLLGFNTDVAGFVRAFAAAGVTRLNSVQVLGAGATAASAVAAVAELGCTRAMIVARSPERAAGLVMLGAALGIEVAVHGWGDSERLPIAAEAIISTVPGGQNDLAFAGSARSDVMLFDVAYDPWPSAIAAEWLAVGGVVISGHELLLQQAIGQVRIFVSGDPNRVLADEDAVVGAMRAALV